jgi:hypothetical protein
MLIKSFLKQRWVKRKTAFQEWVRDMYGRIP